MAAIYNMWSESVNIDTLKAAMTEIYADIPEVTVTTTSGSVSVNFGNGNTAEISSGTSNRGLKINSEWATLGAGTVSSFKYYAKPNGEMLVNTVGSGAACTQWGIGKTTDGSWGAVCIGRTETTNPYYDQMIATGSGVTSKTPRYITNYNATGLNYVALRHCVKHSDVLFDSFYVNTEGKLYSNIVFEMNGEQYASSYNNTSNNNVLVMKL